jgi:hydroxymethylglutaryl-CoA lyase
MFGPLNDNDRDVIVTEVGTRDGFQSEPVYIDPMVKAEVIDALMDAGVRSIEATSFVSPRAVPQLADAHAVLEAVARRPGVRLAALVPNARGAERAAAAKVDMMVCFASASESHSRANLNKPIADALADFEAFAPIAARFGVPWATPPAWPRRRSSSARSMRCVVDSPRWRWRCTSTTRVAWGSPT